MDYKECSDFASLSASLKAPLQKKDTKNDRAFANPCDVADETKTEATTTKNTVDDTFQFPNSTEFSIFTNKLKIISSDDPVSIVSFDATCPSGKLIAGHRTGLLSFYQFARLRPHPTSPQPTRQIRLASALPIPVLVPHFSDASLILTCTHESPPLLLDGVSGKLRQECSRGDRYVVDQRQVKGHTGSIQSGLWISEDGFVTGGGDGTVREWRVGVKEQAGLIGLLEKRTNPDGFKVRPAIGALAKVSGSEILAGVDDGTLMMFDKRKQPNKPVGVFDTLESSFINTIISTDDNCFLARNHSRIVQFDRRRSDSVLSQSCPLAGACNMVRTLDGMTMSAATAGKASRLYFLDEDLNIKGHIAYPDSVVNCIAYSDILKQLVVSDGTNLDIHYGEFSRKGALLYSPPSSTVASDSTFVAPSAANSIIHTPNALPLFALSSSESELLADPLNLRRLKDRLDTALSARPDPPIKGEGHEGRIGAGPNAGYMRAIMSQQARQAGRPVYFDRDEDPREALLRYAEAAEQEPLYVSPAYKDTQPVPVFSTSIGEIVKKNDEVDSANDDLEDKDPKKSRKL